MEVPKRKIEDWGVEIPKRKIEIDLDDWIVHLLHKNNLAGEETSFWARFLVEDYTNVLWEVTEFLGGEELVVEYVEAFWDTLNTGGLTDQDIRKALRMMLLGLLGCVTKRIWGDDDETG